MNLFQNIVVDDLVLYLKKYNSIIIGDIHLGYEEALNRKGVLIPRFQFKDTINRLSNILNNYKKLDSIIINGDLKHEFGVITNQEWREILKLFDFLSKKCNKIILIKGNHDVNLSPIANKRKLEIVEDLFLDSIFITHGHKLPSKDRMSKIKTIIIGNEHPAIVLQDGAKSEKYKCFLKGKWKKKDLIVMPSFQQITIGTDVLEGNFLSPYLHQDLSKFEVFIVEDKVYDFGTIKKISSYNS